MFILGIPAALIPVVFIAYLAFSKKTSPGVKKASIIALVFIGLAFAACVVLLAITLGSTAARGNAYSDLPIIPLIEEKQDIITILIVAAIVLVFTTFIIIVSIREQRRLHGISKKRH
jgi:hypothetical protein